MTTPLHLLLPLEVEGDSFVRSCVVRTTDGWRLAWARDGGRRKEVIAELPPLSSPREAAKLSGRLNARLEP